MKIVFIKVPWMKYYTGEGDEETLVPPCGYNFQHVNGYYYGYSEGLDEIAIEQLEGVTNEEQEVSDVTVVWTAENREGENKVIGWYKHATLYKKAKQHLTQDSERTIFKYSMKAPAKEALLLPVELRLLDARPMDDFIHFEKDEAVMRDIAMYIHNYSGDQMNFVFKDKDLEGQSILNFPEFEMYFAKADEFLEKDLYGKAVRLFNKAIAVEPELAIGYECKGSIFLSLKMYDEALKIYERVLALEPDNEGATYCMGLINGLLGNHEACIDYLSKYLEKRKHDMIALSERAIAYYNLGKIEEAQRDAKKAYKKEPDNEAFKQLIDYISE